MRLLLDGEPSGTQRLRMLVEKRSAALDVIHFKERKLLRLNYLRHEIRKAQRGRGGAMK